MSGHPKPSYPDVPPAAFDPPAAIGSQVWRASLHKGPSPKLSDLLLYGNNNLLPRAPVWQRGSRSRRHASSSGARAHGHLMRVGCVLGTCQVQNLSHRLYQLVGQSRKEDSSPINPRSPHSYDNPSTRSSRRTQPANPNPFAVCTLLRSL
uniref:Adrenomedullin 2b n=1 Tax=Kryptolebias marmoratus TaxID=37003 RepID=A0A3Q3ARX8_KRYMA